MKSISKILISILLIPSLSFAAPLESKGSFREKKRNNQIATCTNRSQSFCLQHQGKRNACKLAPAIWCANKYKAS
jgi:hypothetical protein